MKQENRLIAGTMFAFMVSGATSLALGSLTPFSETPITSAMNLQGC